MKLKFKFLIFMSILTGYTNLVFAQEADEDFMTLDSVEKPAPEVKEETEAEPEPTPEPTPTPTPEPTTEEPPPEEAHKNYTADYDNYENKEKTRYKKVKPVHWSAGFTYALNPFRRADFRVRQSEAVKSNFKNPKLYGFIFHGERFLFQNVGVLSLGAEMTIYSRASVDGFSNLFPGFLSGGVFGRYRGRFHPNQWVLPVGRGGVDWLYYSYQFNGGKVNGFRFMPRFEFGLDIFLNFLDPSASKDMYFNYKIVRAYLTGMYSISTDFNKKDFDLTDRSFRVGFRLEF